MIINIYFGKKEPDLRQWAYSVPKGLFSYYVREAIKAYLDKNFDYKLPFFNNKNNKNTKENIIKPLSILRNTPEEEKIYNFVLMIEKNLRSFKIKQILKIFLPVFSENSKNDENIIENRNISKECPSNNNKKNKITQMIQSSVNRSRINKA